MRRLAECAQLSTRTLYNLYGAKEDILFALMAEGMRETDAKLGKSSPADPLERSRALLTVSIDQLCARTAFNRALYRGFEPGVGRASEFVSKARDRQQVMLEAAQDMGLLQKSVSARVLAHHIVTGYGFAVRLWCREVLDNAQLKAHALHARALCLLAVALAPARARLEREIEALAPEMQSLVKSLDESATHSAASRVQPHPEAEALLGR